MLDPKKTGSGFRRRVHWSAGPQQCWTIIPEKKHNWRVAYSPVLAGNAVVCMYNTGGEKPWHVVAASRTNRQLLWDLAMLAQPVTGGLSLTRAGDVLVPLVDGRVVCIGDP